MTEAQRSPTSDGEAGAGTIADLKAGPKIGQRVLIAGKQVGVVRFFGPTDFAEGSWIGVELDEPRGKNNGTVKGRTYFECAESCGIFVRQAVVEKWEDAVRQRKQLSPSSARRRQGRVEGTSSQEQQQQHRPSVLASLAMKKAQYKAILGARQGAAEAKSTALRLQARLEALGEKLAKRAEMGGAGVTSGRSGSFAAGSQAKEAVVKAQVGDGCASRSARELSWRKKARHTAKLPLAPEVEEAMLKLAAEMGPAPKVCIVGSTAFQSEGSEDLFRRLALALAQRVGKRAVFITGGLSGASATFAQHFGSGAPMFHLMPWGERSGFQHGVDRQMCKDQPQKREVVGRLADIYISIEGGPGVGEEILLAHRGGARVVPLARTGGASSGMFTFPQEALRVPPHIPEDLWALLSDEGADIQQSAEAAAQIVMSHIAQLEQGDPYSMELISGVFELLDTKRVGMLSSSDLHSFVVRMCGYKGGQAEFAAEYKALCSSEGWANDVETNLPQFQAFVTNRNSPGHRTTEELKAILRENRLDEVLLKADIGSLLDRIGERLRTQMCEDLKQRADSAIAAAVAKAFEPTPPVEK
mmetsp:Transcript_118874/g.343816  ORF Transcript_118874/g.343816 Transcript_118874/m.343816 type:complete len:585 (-) Transcript_118874:117-1871(-)